MNQTFDQWMKEVNNVIGKFCGLSSDDLPDICYSDLFEEGATLKQAAKQAIKYAQGDDSY